MSYNLVNPTTGDLTRVAGRGKAEYGASSVRSGTYIPSSPVQAQEDLSFSVTFSEPMPDNDYQVIFGSSSYGDASGTIQCVVRSRSTTGFTGIIRNVGMTEVSVASGTFTWFAFKLYSDVEYSNIVNSMPSDASASNKLVTASDTTKVIQLSGVVDLDSLSDYARYMGKAQIVTSLSGTTGLSSDFVSNILNGGFIIDYINTSNTNTENFGVQVLCGYNSNSIYLRTKTYSSGSWGWSSWQKLVTESDVNPIIDVSTVWDDTNHTLNISTLLAKYGLGSYMIYGQGNSGHGCLLLNAWKVISGAFAYSWQKIYNNNFPTNMYGGGVVYDSPTLTLENTNMGTVNDIKRISKI